MDLKDGIVVHARRGERVKYAPVHKFSSIVSSSDPLHVISAVRPSEVYIADLDRIMYEKSSNRNVISAIRDVVGEIMIDYGVRSVEDALEAAEIANNVVIGTETASLKLIDDVIRRIPGGVNVSVSVDIKNGKILTKDPEISKFHPLSFIKLMNEYALNDIIVLDIDRIGTKEGVNIDFLRDAVRISSHNVLCGGGVRGCDDLKILKSAGVSGVLVATAVHDGSVPPEHLRAEDAASGY
ncbi:phosphoribosylformimino-5-aminoimidazole carboxamide ribotide isomerase [Methanosarcinales archaeon]|nr:MAG: phosphoribosylformimino-5-aminoimidazole carboxamide ribotide isomerase [Methanosarcinales archaeon]